MKKKISLKWKIFAGFLSFTLILLVLLWVLQILCLDDFYVFIKSNEVKQTTDSAKKVVSDAEDITESDDLAESLRDLAQTENVSILLTDEEGNTLCSAQYNPMGQMESIPSDTFLSLYQAAKEAGGETEISYTGSLRWDEQAKPSDQSIPQMGLTQSDQTTDSQSQESDQTTDSQSQEIDQTMDSQSQESNLGNAKPDIMQGGKAANLGLGQEGSHDKSVIYVCILSADDKEVVLLVSAMLTPVDATVSTLKVQLCMLSIFLILISLLVAWLASRAISKSLIRLNGSAKKLAEGDYSVTFDESDYGEIAQLSDTLNYAVGELSKTEDLRKELIANVSHDLRTPLTMMKAYGEVMRDIPGENSPENIQVIIDETNRLSALVNDMLDVSQLEAGTISLHLEKFDLTELLEETVLRYSKLKEKDGYTFSLEAKEHVWVEADVDKITQVLCNLLNNAINYAGDKKTIMIRQKLVGQTVRIDVIDSGLGIAPEEIPYVWNRYYKGDKARKSLVVGTGLGLSIVQKILELHGASYGVESSPGMGADFWFCFKKV